MKLARGVLCATDRVPPSGSFTSPAAGNVSGTITVAVNAADNDKVASVQFKVDGTNIGSAVTVAPFQVSHDTRTLLNGSHTYSAVITDRIGNNVTITQLVTNANAPVVNITSPTNGSNINGSVNLTATVTSYDASISVQFKIDGVNQGSAQTSGPFQILSYDTHLLTATGHTFSVVATDGHSNSTTASVTATVNNSVPTGGTALLGDWQLWDGSSYSSGRNPLPNYNDRDVWDWIWQNTAAKFGYVSLPGNPDSTHYQMKAQMVGSRLEGGAIDLIINGVEQAASAPAGFSYQGGTIYNLNGGESLGGRCWINGAPDADEGANTFFEQGIGLIYWFVVKAGYQS